MSVKPAELFFLRIRMAHHIDPGQVCFLCTDYLPARNALAVFEDECARIVREEVARAMEASGAVPEVERLRAALAKLQDDYQRAVGHATDEESHRWKAETKLLRVENELAKLQADHDKAVARGTDEAAHSWRVEGKLLTSERQNRALLSENARLHKELAAFADRIAAQSEALPRAAERNPERDACARLEAWKKAHAEEGWCAEIRHFAHMGWHVRLFRWPIADPKGVVESFSDRHPGRAMLGPFKGEAYCQHDDGTDATIAETLAAALDKWEEIHGQKNKEG